MHWLGIVQVVRTSSNLLEPHHCRDSKVCRVDCTKPLSTSLEGKLGDQFGVVQAHQTSSNHVQSSFTCSGWFACTEPNYIFTEEARCVGYLCTSLGQFKHTNLLEPHHYRVCRVLQHEFWVVRQNRTFSKYIFIGEARSAGCLCTRSEQIKCIELPRTTLLQR